MAGKKKEPTFWSTSANGKSRSGGDAYGKRNNAKKAGGQGCALLLIVGASVLTGLSVFAGHAMGWVL